MSAGLELVVGVARGGAAGVRRGLGLRGGLILRRGEEVHDPLAVDEDAEDLAGEFVDDFEAAAIRRLEVEEGVLEGEVEQRPFLRHRLPHGIRHDPVGRPHLPRCLRTLPASSMANPNVRPSLTTALVRMSG